MVDHVFLSVDKQKVYSFKVYFDRPVLKLQHCGCYYECFFAPKHVLREGTK